MSFKSLNYLLISTLFLFIYSCEGVDTDGAEAAADVELVEEDNNPDGAGASTKVEYILPSPMEIAGLIKSTGISYEEGIMNPTSKVDGYNDNYKKAINLGVYGADLGLILVFEQTQDAISYFKTVQSLTEELGIAGAFEQGIMNRVEANLGNQDSLMVMAADAFSNADMYLKENDRQPISTLVLAGGWIEALYISCSFGISTKDAQILNRIGEQKVSLGTLINMMDRVKQEGPEYEALNERLKELNMLFDKVNITYTEIPAEPDPENSITEVKRISSVEITEVVFDEIASNVNTLRAELVK
jgi:hypothetical protein